MSYELSRRQFLSAAAAASYVPYLRGASPETPPGRATGIIDLTNSPFAKMRTVPIRAVRMSDGFWAKRIKVNLEASLLFTYQQMEEHGRFDNFLRWDGNKQSLRAGFRTNHPSGLRAGGDSETYKWIEAASFALGFQDLPELRKRVKQLATDVIGAQEPSGYLNTYFVEDRAADRMLPATQVTGLELYNCGHLLMAAIAWYRAAGNRSLLDAALRCVNNFLLPNYGPELNKQPLLSGHPGAEMGLVELYRTTGDNRHLKLAAYILEGDGRIPLERGGSVLARGDLAFNSRHLFCGIPFTSRTKLTGHVVRALYACCGAADYYLETGDPAYGKSLEALWHDLVNHKMYITGGVGSRGLPGEAFGESYELPNLTAYSESCAAIANLMWNWRLLCATGEARFADVMERCLYNGVNSGTSLDGKLYNYCNPLALDGSVPWSLRKPWYFTYCCPTNLVRTFASIPGYVYGTAKDGIYVHLFDNSELNWRLENGVPIKLVQTTDYPWGGNVELTVMPARPTEFAVYVRIPGWSRTTKVHVNGTAVSDAQPGQYLPIVRRWSGRDRINLRFDMTPRLTAANPKVESDSRRVAIERGPLVYCMEQVDQAESGALDGFSLAVNEGTEKRIDTIFESQVLGGIVMLRAPGLYSAAPAELGQTLYGPLTASSKKPVTLSLIPYYAFGNRQASAMQVWIPYVSTVA